MVDTEDASVSGKFSGLAVGFGLAERVREHVNVVGRKLSSVRHVNDDFLILL